MGSKYSRQRKSLNRRRGTKLCSVYQKLSDWALLEDSEGGKGGCRWGHVMEDLSVILRNVSVRKHSPLLPTRETRVSETTASGAKAHEPQAG